MWLQVLVFMTVKAPVTVVRSWCAGQPGSCRVWCSTSLMCCNTCCQVRSFVPWDTCCVQPLFELSMCSVKHSFDIPMLKYQQFQPKVQVKPVTPKPTPHVDKKTLQALNTPPPTPAPTPAPEPPKEEPKLANPIPAQPAPALPQPPADMPRPSAVPARPNFAMGSHNPADQLQDAMRGASRNQGPFSGQLPSGGAGLARHPGAGSGGVEVLSDTQGVDFRNWLIRWHRETENTWDPLIPDEVNPPINKSGMVVIRFKVLPNGRLMDGSVQLEGRSGDTALDRAAWGALTGSNYPPLPSAFHGPYIDLRATFLYNMGPK